MPTNMRKEWPRPSTQQQAQKQPLSRKCCFLWRFYGCCVCLCLFSCSKCLVFGQESELAADRSAGYASTQQEPEPPESHSRPEFRKAALIDLDALRSHEFYPADLAASLLTLDADDPAVSADLRSWSRETLTALDVTISAFVQQDYQSSWKNLQRVEQAAVQLATFRQPLVNKSYAVKLEELQLGLERRAILWRLAFLAAATPHQVVSRHYTKDRESLERLRENTLAVERFFLNDHLLKDGKRGANNQNIDNNIGHLWCEYLDTASFLREIDSCRALLQEPVQQVSAEVSQIPLPVLVSICDRANVALQRMEASELSPSQHRFLNVDVVAAWKQALADWSADTVSPFSLLYAIEKFEQNGGMSDMETLFRLATRASFSPTEEHRRFGMLILDLYGNANVKVYLSEVFINHLLPPMKPEQANFREIIQGQTVFGRRQADMNVVAKLIPDEEHLRFALDVSGDIQTRSWSNAFATTLFNTGRSEVEAQRTIELTEQGFQLSPSTARVKSSRLRLNNIQTDFDVPLISSLVRNVVKNQYESRAPETRQETHQKMLRQLRSRVDSETNDRFREFNEKYVQFQERMLTHFGLLMESKNSSTEEDWLLGSWVFHSQDALAGHTPAPETLPGAFVDLKVHESLLNTMIGKLDLDGKVGTVGEFRQQMAAHFHRPEMAEPGENDNVKIGFADYNPITVRFTDSTIVLSISIKSLKIGRQTHRDFQVIVRYRPEYNEQGELVLRRDPVVNLINGRAQIVLRAVFGKIFPEQRAVPLTPQFFQTDPRFAGLTTGHCRIEKGWLAVALVADEPLEMQAQAVAAQERAM